MAAKTKKKIKRSMAVSEERKTTPNKPAPKKAAAPVKKVKPIKTDKKAGINSIKPKSATAQQKSQERIRKAVTKVKKVMGRPRSANSQKLENSIRVYFNPETLGWINGRTANSTESKSGFVQSQMIAAMQRESKLGGATEMERFSTYLRKKIAKGRMEELKPLSAALIRFLRALSPSPENAPVEVNTIDV